MVERGKPLVSTSETCVTLRKRPMDSLPPFVRKHLLKGVGVLFFASMFASCTELRYLAWGRKTQGRVIDVSPSSLARPGETLWRMRYEFRDNGQVRHEETRLAEGQRRCPPREPKWRFSTFQARAARRVSPASATP